MTAASGGASAPGSPGGRSAAGAPPAGRPQPEGTPAPVAAEARPADLDDLPLEEMSLEEAIHRVEEAEHEGRPPAAGTPSNLVTAVVVIALGGAALAGAVGLGLGTAAEPGSGTWPMLVAVVTVLIGVALVAVARRAHDSERFTRSSLLVLVGLATMVVFVALLPVIGFEIPAALLCFVWLRFLGAESWRLSLGLSVGLVAAFYLVFVGALGVSIPHLF
ncbi:tripartite tricarboxylate transporter TctB family protein [Geodermatophilus sp. DSM 45219]|uniref:tripartite tricarboxylate transporter TctB family protein n=1 Tax=Geodermatophilus sp. DSM 45219 TaxID=1881103 RepID=UPI00087E1670|nr:tripartite tricarboxylate transporter TctB family protein [Geodermatophilus sp. DSM 45219]SDN75138.1 Tripartite tricarboxylate transporter TctB family protein [Geodermatophilus sp. DSM 45219]